MVIVYSQAADYEGLIAAVDGALVAPGDTRIAELREKAVALNLSKTPYRAEGVEVLSGNGIVRLEIAVAGSEETIVSPIVVVANVTELLADRDGAVQRAVESAIAIGRHLDAAAVAAGFVAGERFYQSGRKKRRIATVIAIAVVALSVVLLARSCAGSGELFGAADSWTH
tara:strand:- start:4621 stop:5130 length:510 start_codon:yes stop_codon:yes gene_type:complete